jgi:hypothetical protein
MEVRTSSSRSNEIDASCAEIIVIAEYVLRAERKLGEILVAVKAAGQIGVGERQYSSPRSLPALAQRALGDLRTLSRDLSLFARN